MIALRRLVFLAWAVALGPFACAGDTTADGLVKEYSVARDAGLARMDLQYVLRLGALKSSHLQSGDLDGANAIDQSIKTVTSGTSSAVTAKNKPADSAPENLLPADAAAVLREREAAMRAGLAKLAQIYVGKMQAAKAAALKSGDLEGANAANVRLATLSEDLQGLMPKRTGEVPGNGKDETTVEAYIDGNTELHVNKQGLFWKVLGGEFKPGRHDGKKYACYVDGSKWEPEWKNKSNERGPDTSEVWPLPTAFPKLTAERVFASSQRFGRNDPNRTTITSASKNGDFVVTIPDPEAGACWYKIKIRAIKR